MCQLLPGVVRISRQAHKHCTKVSRAPQRDDSTCPQRVISCLPFLLAVEGNRNSRCALDAACQPAGTGQGMHGMVTEAIGMGLGPAARSSKSFSVLLGRRLCPFRHGNTVLPVKGSWPKARKPLASCHSHQTSPEPPLLLCPPQITCAPLRPTDKPAFNSRFPPCLLLHSTDPGHYKQSYC